VTRWLSFESRTSLASSIIASLKYDSPSKKRGYYYARIHHAWPIPDGKKVMVPTGYAAFPKEIIRPPRPIAETVYGNIQRWTAMAKGGHFAAMEQPNMLASDIAAFFRGLR
jgi:hypothetical protein